jgi:hypothetical protein
MRFNPGVISKAAFRQYDNKKLGTPCAKCGTYLIICSPHKDKPGLLFLVYQWNKEVNRLIIA